MTMPLPLNDPYIEAIAQRVRTVVRQPGYALDVLARTLDLPYPELRRLIEEPDRMIDTPFLLDALSALVRVFALDPKWLLTGEYDAAVHRRALELTEANPRVAERTVREWLREQYRRLCAGLDPTSLMEQ
jgi:hypothetical protein